VSTPDIDQELLRRGQVVLRVDGPVATVTLDRPESRNAQLPETWVALAHLGNTLTEDIRVVVVCGEGRSFSAGLDLSAFAPTPSSLLGATARAPQAVAEARIAEFQRGFTWLSDPRFISIAAVAGHAIGAGFQLALACDLIVAADNAEFRMAEVSYGLVPDLTGTGRLLRLVGYQRALEICATGRHVHAEEAVRIGLALCAVPLDQLDATVADLAAALVESPVEAVRTIKGLLAGAHDRTVAEQHAAERAAQVPLLHRLAAAAAAAAESDAAR